MSSFPAGRLVGEHLYVMRYSVLPAAVNFSIFLIFFCIGLAEIFGIRNSSHCLVLFIFFFSGTRLGCFVVSDTCLSLWFSGK